MRPKEWKRKTAGKDRGWDDELVQGYAAYFAWPLAYCLERISVGGCIVNGDGTNPKCCAYCAAAVAIAAYRASVGRVRG